MQAMILTWPAHRSQVSISNFGVRIPLGLDYYFSGAPFDIFATVVPVLVIIPSTDFALEAAVGFRFWF
jgi:hypothetical protein